MKHPLSRKLLALCTTVALSFSLALSPLASWAEQPQKALENTQLTEQLPSLESPAEQPSLELETETNNTPQSDTALPTPKGNSDEAAPATNALAEQAAEEVSAKKPLVILHTNDVHCGASQAVDKQGNPTTVGYAGVSTILKEAETTYGKEHVCVTDISSRAFYCSSYWQLPFSDCPFDCTDSLVSHTCRTSVSTYHKLLAKIPCVVFFIMPHISQLLGRVYLYPPKIKIKWCVISY